MDRPMLQSLLSERQSWLALRDLPRDDLLAAQQTIGSDCSGLDCCIYALRKLGIEHKHLFSCDNDDHARQWAAKNHSPHRYYEDLRDRRSRSDQDKKITGYITGFPCRPFSVQNSSSRGMSHKDADLPACVVAETMRARPQWAVYENVLGLRQYLHGPRGVFSIFQKGGLLKEYFVFVLPIDPQKTLRVPHRRPRLYFVLVRKADAVCSNVGYLSELIQTLLEKLTTEVRRRPCPGLPDLQGETVSAETCKGRPNGKIQKQQWPKVHKAFCEKNGIRPKTFSESQAPGLTPRERDVLGICVAQARQQRASRDDFQIVDVSQSAHRAPTAFNGVPCLTTSSKLVLVPPGADKCKVLSGRDKLRLIGIMPEQCVIENETMANALHRLCGNAMHVDAVALAMVLGMSLVSWKHCDKLESTAACHSNAVVFTFQTVEKGKRPEGLPRKALLSMKRLRNGKGKAARSRSSVSHATCQVHSDRKRKSAAQSSDAPKKRRSLGSLFG
ncbi:unnamed protein product [Symbiodinium sp. CCMP2592]|nr:unnamed protein product [Symbiodinium sp. CCMP2592]